MISWSAITSAESFKLYSVSSGFLSKNSASPNAAPISTSMTASVRASDLIRFISPRPTAEPIITAEEDDIATTITFKYW